MQDSPRSSPRISAVKKMLEGGVEVILPAKSFCCVYSVAIHGLKPPNRINATSRHSTNDGSNSYR